MTTPRASAYPPLPAMAVPVLNASTWTQLASAAKLHQAAAAGKQDFIVYKNLCDHMVLQ